MKQTSDSHRDLLGRRIVVTRPRAQAKELVARLVSLGAEPVVMPAIRIRPPTNPAPLDDAVRRADEFDWIVFGSVNAVDAFFERLQELGRGVRSLDQVRLAAIGAKTEGAIRSRGLTVDVVPQTFQAEALVEALARQGVKEASILIPRAVTARDALTYGLRSEGARVHEVAAYETVMEKLDPVSLELFKSGEIDALTFTSSSTVRSFARLVKGVGLRWPPECKTFCIGPITAETARREGLSVEGIAEPHTVDGLVSLLVDGLSKEAETEVVP